MKKHILKIIALLAILSFWKINLTNAVFGAQTTIVDNTVTTSYWATPSVTVTSPNGGEAWTAGSFHNITWTAVSSDPGGTINTIDIYLSIDGGATYLTTLVSGIANTGSYSWTIGDPKSTTMKVKVVATDNHGLVGSDESDNIFDPVEEQTWACTPAPTGEPESSPNPSPTPNPEISPTPTPTPSDSPTETPAPTPEEMDSTSLTTSPTPTPAASPTETPTVTPEETVSSTPTPTASPTDEPTPTLEEITTPSPTPNE